MSGGGDLPVGRLGFGGMRITGEEIVGEPDDPEAAPATCSAGPAVMVDCLDTGFGPHPAKLFVITAGI